MNKIKLFFLVILSSITLFSCDKSDDSTVAIRDYAEQYATDLSTIENYLKSNYMTVTTDTSTGYIDATFSTTKTGSTVWDQTDYPLQSVELYTDTRDSFYVDGKNTTNTVKYKLYYMVLNQGGGQTPKNIDSTFTTYKGWTISSSSTTSTDAQFDKSDSPLWFTYPGTAVTISGYRQILSKIKTAASYTQGTDGVIKYNNPGTVIVFIPSGLAYYNTGSGTIGSYTPIAFRIRLMGLRQRDHDLDKVMSDYEDLNNDKDFFNDDTDGDNIPNFLDQDDDGDKYYTKDEIRYAAVKDPSGNVITPAGFYSYNLIPDCNGTFTGTKKHLDKNCK